MHVFCCRRCYELGQFENAVHYMRIQAEKVLDRFFRYNKTVVVTTSDESYKRLKHCEEQVKHKTVLLVPVTHTVVVLVVHITNVVCGIRTS